MKIDFDFLLNLIILYVFLNFIITYIMLRVGYIKNKKEKVMFLIKNEKKRNIFLFFTPKFIYNNSKLNFLTCIFLSLLYFIFDGIYCIFVTLILFLYWISHIGRNYKNDLIKEYNKAKVKKDIHDLKCRFNKNEYIIFLDIDGVMNNSGIENEFHFIDESIEVLNRLKYLYEAKIVITSSWKEVYTFKQLENLFKENGCKCNIIDTTPSYIGSLSSTSLCDDNEKLLSEKEFYENLKEDEGRNKEIIDYVKIHDIKNYVIIDDFPFTNKELIPHCVLTSYNDEKNGGLRFSHLYNIRRILKGEFNNDME